MPDFLVHYGRSAYVGRFAHDGELKRQQRVVIESPRGIELGTLLGTAKFAGEPDARLLRLAGPDDTATADKAEALARRILTVAEEAPFPVTFLDCEVLLAETAILHAVPYESCNLDPLIAELSDHFALTIKLLNVAAAPTLKDPPEPKSSCGSGGCGTGGGCSTGGCGTKSEGGCSTGSCSKGKVKSAEELTNYFADLRTKMETRVPLV